LFFAACGTATPPAEAPAADLILKNGRIVTMDERLPEARALAARDSRIVALGDDGEIRKFAGPKTRTIDLGGRLAVPGFIESHGHFTGLGRAQLNLRLGRTRSWHEIVAMVGEAVKKARPGEWIEGRGWHQEKWNEPPLPAVEGFPVHQALSAVSPDNPVVLEHASGHAAIVNAKAMALSAITAATPNPRGGEILKDSAGNPTGLLRETAENLLVRSRLGDAAPLENETAAVTRYAELADRECLSKGITSFDDAGSSFDTIDVLRKMASEKRLGVRLWVMVREPNAVLAEKLASYRASGEADNHFTLRAIKVTVDGALGSRGAWLLEPYADAPSSTGLNIVPMAELAETARLAMRHGFQLAVHAIGDRANREVLNVFEAAFRANPDRRDVRWRIEHAQHLDPADIPRFGALHVIASMQGIHAASDGPFVIARLGPRRARAGAYVWRSLLDTGATIVNGTDAPVEDVSPVGNFYASVTRRMVDGKDFFPAENMTRMEALRSYTTNAAFAAFEEDLKGSLTPGKLADITVLSRDILTIPVDQIPGTDVDYTIVGGKVLYEGGRR
jgi:predicted amidohydrolase YtcJ